MFDNLTSRTDEDNNHIVSCTSNGSFHVFPVTGSLPPPACCRLRCPYPKHLSSQHCPYPACLPSAGYRFSVVIGLIQSEVTAIVRAQSVMYIPCLSQGSRVGQGTKRSFLLPHVSPGSSPGHTNPLVSIKQFKRSLT